MSENAYPTAKVGDQEVPWDPEQLRKIQEHPCFSEKACHRFGRMHLAVAPRCNIQCNYCIRDFGIMGAYMTSSRNCMNILPEN